MSKSRKEQAKALMQQAIPEAKAAGMVGIGMLAAAFLGKGVDKLAEQMPGMVDALPYVKAGAMFLTGVGVATFAAQKQKKPDEFNPMKLLGYGVAGAGLVQGVVSIPAVQEALTGIDLNQLPTKYYTESLENVVRGSIGESDLPIVEAENASPFEVMLPELETASGTDSFSNEFLAGFGNVQAVETEDVEFSEVI